jgi:hypothetical protein
MRPIRRSERGEGNFGCLFGLVLLAIAALFAYKMIPVKVKNAEMRAAIVDEAKSAGTHNDGVIREYIYAKAMEDHLPLSKDDIRINRTRDEISIDVEYTVPIEFPGFTYQWHVAHHASNPIF